MEKTPADTEFDDAALDAAYEAFFDADGGNHGGVRAAIKAYNRVANASRFRALAERNGFAVVPLDRPQVAS